MMYKPYEREFISCYVLYATYISTKSYTYMQRFLMAKSPGQLSETLNNSALIMSIFCIIIMAIGLCARHFTPGISDTDSVLPALITYLYLRMMR